MKKYLSYANRKIYNKRTRTLLFSFLLAILFCLGNLGTAAAATVSGSTKTIPCPNCKDGWLTCSYCGGKGTTAVGNPCFLCDQKGKVPCGLCGGTGKIESTSTDAGTDSQSKGSTSSGSSKVSRTHHTKLYNDVPELLTVNKIRLTKFPDTDYCIGWVTQKTTLLSKADIWEIDDTEEWKEISKNRYQCICTDYLSSKTKYNQVILDFEIEGDTLYYDMKTVSWDGKEAGYDVTYKSLMNYMELILDRNPLLDTSFAVSDPYYEELNKDKVASTVDCTWCNGTGMSNLSCYHCDGSGCAWCKYGYQKCSHCNGTGRVRNPELNK